MSSSSSPQISAENLQITDMKKRKRMISNRESARRSRMRKQRHVEDLTAQVTDLRAQNNHILINVNFTTQLYLNTESENSILRAQISELSCRLRALEGIIACITSDCAPGFDDCCDYDYDYDYDDEQNMIINGVGDFAHFNHPIMASPDVFMY